MRPQSDTAHKAHNMADVRMDAGDEEVARLLNACGGEISELLRHLARLAWAARESNKRKRLAALEAVRAEMENQGYSTAFLPMRELQQ
jgi:hypothetical protein